MANPLAGLDDLIRRLGQQRGMVPPPPPPPPPVATVKQWRHPMQDQWDRRVHEFAKVSGSLPPPDDGNIRMYRAGAVPQDSPRHPDDIITGPFGDKMTRREFHSRYGKEGFGTNPLAAEGRWFTDAADELDYYLRENDTSPVYYIDMPADVAQQYNVANTPFASSSRNHRREFVLPIENANSAIRILGGLAAP